MGHYFAPPPSEIWLSPRTGTAPVPRARGGRRGERRSLQPDTFTTWRAWHGEGAGYRCGVARHVVWGGVGVLIDR